MTRKKKRSKVMWTVKDKKNDRFSQKLFRTRLCARMFAKDMTVHSLSNYSVVRLKVTEE